MKRFLLILVGVLTCVLFEAAMASPITTRVKVNNFYLLWIAPANPYVSNGTLMFPLIGFASLSKPAIQNAPVTASDIATFDAATETITFRFAKKTLTFVVDSTSVTVKDSRGTRVVSMRVPLVMEGARLESTFVSLRDISTLLEYRLTWDAPSSTVSLEGAELMQSAQSVYDEWKLSVRDVTTLVPVAFSQTIVSGANGPEPRTVLTVQDIATGPALERAVVLFSEGVSEDGRTTATIFDWPEGFRKPFPPGNQPIPDACVWWKPNFRRCTYGIEVIPVLDKSMRYVVARIISG